MSFEVRVRVGILKEILTNGKSLRYNVIKSKYC